MGKLFGFFLDGVTLEDLGFFIWGGLRGLFSQKLNSGIDSSSDSQKKVFWRSYLPLPPVTLKKNTENLPPLNHQIHWQSRKEFFNDTYLKLQTYFFPMIHIKWVFNLILCNCYVIANGLEEQISNEKSGILDNNWSNTLSFLFQAFQQFLVKHRTDRSIINTLIES